MAKQKVLYIVHPDSILEQHTHIDHVKPYLDKIDKAISGFNGPVIISKLGTPYPDRDDKKLKQGIDYVKTFMGEKKQNPKVSVISEKRVRDLLGKNAMAEFLDDFFLNEELDEIILGGAFTCDNSAMCVDDTYKALVKEYGKEIVKKDPKLILKAGPVDTSTFKAATRVAFNFLKNRD